VTVNNELIGKWKIITSRLTAEHAGETDKNISVYFPLYAKYGLTDEEIAFIESMIKPME
jgi:hypothetical protein